MKTIVIVVTQGRLVRNLLRTDVLEVLKSNKNLRIVIAVLYGTPFFNDKNFEAEFTSGNVVVKNIGARTNIIERALRKMADLIFFNINHVDTIKIKDQVFKHKKPASYLGLRIIRKILGRNRNLMEATEKLDETLFRYKHRHYKELFETYKPDLVFETDFIYAHEWGLVKAAKYYKVPVISMVASWDHLTKGRIPGKSDRVIVWNNVLKSELMDYYAYKEDEVFVSGIPEFDYYINEKDKLPSREEFLKNISAPPNEKLVTYTTSPPTISPFEPDLVEILCEAVKNQRVVFQSHLHVRFHPADGPERYETLKKYGGLITFEKPGRFSYSNRFAWNPDREDMLHFAGLLKHSDVVINMASTVTIDASAFDTPVVNVAFDGYQERPYWDSALRYYDQTHYKNVAATKGSRIAKNGEELIRYVNDYLKDPKLDSEGRKRITSEQCYKLDGKSGRRIAEYILKFIGENG